MHKKKMMSVRGEAYTQIKSRVQRSFSGPLNFVSWANFLFLPRFVVKLRFI